MVGKRRRPPDAKPVCEAGAAYLHLRPAITHLGSSTLPATSKTCAWQMLLAQASVTVGRAI
eukprot:1410913-Pyramimonas_sp.AAC.1